MHIELFKSPLDERFQLVELSRGHFGQLAAPMTAFRPMRSRREGPMTRRGDAIRSVAAAREHSAAALGLTQRQSEWEGKSRGKSEERRRS